MFRKIRKPVLNTERREKRKSVWQNKKPLREVNDYDKNSSEVRNTSETDWL